MISHSESTHFKGGQISPNRKMKTASYCALSDNKHVRRHVITDIIVISKYQHREAHKPHVQHVVCHSQPNWSANKVMGLNKHSSNSKANQRTGGLKL